MAKYEILGGHSLFGCRCLVSSHVANGGGGRQGGEAGGGRGEAGGGELEGDPPWKTLRPLEYFDSISPLTNL